MKTKPKNTTTDMTWTCGCRTYKDGLFMKWGKCGLHEGAAELFSSCVRLASWFLETYGALSSHELLKSGCANELLADVKALKAAIAKAEAKS
jgi:hypothetical protein